MIYVGVIMEKNEEKRINELEQLTKELVTRIEKLEKDCVICVKAQKQCKDYQNKMSDNIRGF
jgi:hypothetical protein